ncbi:hypothetical protein F8M41_004603 [Gigaspora margarita]|uniref:Uncharacterized protein n=1 Tax=Gigaspora margarita TaxID=4874 RepID=A0A8H4AXL6_GIGMA|nr:hypothetical protein F8M41_004603 [Gigaspora margarita]
MEETFDNAEFDSDKMQKNELEVLLKEVTAEYNALIQNWPLERKNPSENPRIEKVKEFQGTAAWDRRKVEEPTGETVKINDFNRRYEAGYELAWVDYANGIEDPEDCQTRGEVEKDRYKVVYQKLSNEIAKENKEC